MVINPITLSYSTDNGVTFTQEATGEANDGAYSWSVPNVNSTQVILRITYTDRAGNTQTQDGGVFTIGQPDMDLVTIQAAESFNPDVVRVFQQNNNTYKLAAAVLNSGLAKVPGGEDVNFNSGTNLVASCTLPKICDFNQNANILGGGPINPGARKDVRMLASVDKPNPGTYVNAITITADDDLSLAEVSETNNSVDVTLFVAGLATYDVDVGACTYPDLFSSVAIKFSTVSVIRDSQVFPMYTVNDPVDVLALKLSSRTETVAIENLSNGFTGLRLGIESVTGVRSDTGEPVVFNLTSSFLEVPQQFTVPTEGIANGTVYIDLANSIQQTSSDTFNFTPTLLDKSTQTQVWGISLDSELILVKTGEAVDIPVRVTNNGSVDDTYTLEFFSQNEDLTFEFPTAVEVAAGSSTIVNLRLTAPYDIGGQSQIEIPFQLSAVATLERVRRFIALPPVQTADATLRVVYVPPPTFDPEPLLDNLMGACNDISVSGTPDLHGDLQANGKVTVTGQAIVNGDITAGQFKRTGKAQVTGSVTVSLGTLNCLPIDLESIHAAIQNNGKGIIPPDFLQDGVLVVDEQKTLLLASGTYLLDGLTIAGGASLLTDGTVNLFVRGPVTVAGHSFTNQSETTNFVVFSDSSAPVEIAGNSAFNGVVYAPYADLSLAGTSDARGHFFADNIAASGTTLDIANPPGVGTLVSAGYVPKGGRTVRAMEIRGNEQKAKIEVIIPSGALKAPKRITISKEVHKNKLDEDKKLAWLKARDLKAVTVGAEYGPEGTTFEKPVTLSFAYDANNLPENVAENDLKIYYWNPSTSEWEEMFDSQVDKNAKRVFATTNHFSLYKVLGKAAQPAANPSADATFTMGEVYVFPSPATGGAAPTFHVETGIADLVTIRVYDINGQQVHETTLTGSPKMIGQKYAYEYPWQARIASGVYLYVVTSERQGNKLVKTGKFAVVR